MHAFFVLFVWIMANKFLSIGFPFALSTPRDFEAICQPLGLIHKAKSVRSIRITLNQVLACQGESLMLTP